ncbi:MAG: hypothetical protein MUC92_08760 [Fimbriimonadaceae bacterium]|jgi:protein-arginine kinase activator protein McsA|nr:hypothetical protein [Fimbriimonadaceae bacterium]
MRAIISDSTGYKVETEVAKVDDLTGFTGLGRLIEKMSGQPTWVPACPCCGWTRKQASETGLMGCGFCYVTLWPIKRRPDKT